eukprot:1648543-Prorocentrum_lima.AAC.1
MVGLKWERTLGCVRYVSCSCRGTARQCGAFFVSLDDHSVCVVIVRVVLKLICRGGFVIDVGIL